MPTIVFAFNDVSKELLSPEATDENPAALSSLRVIMSSRCPLQRKGERYFFEDSSEKRHHFHAQLPPHFQFIILRRAKTMFTCPSGDLQSHWRTTFQHTALLKHHSRWKCYVSILSVLFNAIVPATPPASECLICSRQISVSVHAKQGIFTGPISVITFSPRCLPIHASCESFPRGEGTALT